MAESSFDKFTRLSGLLREGDLKPLYLILGPEQFLTTLFIKQVKDAFKKGYGDSGEISILHGEDVKRDELESYLSGGGLFSSASLVILHNISGLDANARKYLEQVAASNHQDLVLVLTHGESYRAPQWITKLGKLGQIIPADTPWDNEIPRIVRRFAEIRKKKIQPQAIELLMQMTGNNLALIEQEIEKLDLFLAETTDSITVDAVQESIAAVPHATLLNLFDAVNQRNSGSAIHALSDIISKDDSIPYLVISLYNHFNKILGYKDFSGFPDASTARAITGSNSPRYQRSLYSAANHYSRKELEAAMIELAEIDYQVRQQSVPAITYFSIWVANHLN